MSKLLSRCEYVVLTHQVLEGGITLTSAKIEAEPSVRIGLPHLRQSVLLCRGFAV